MTDREMNKIEALFDTTDLVRQAPASVTPAKLDGETDPRGPHYWRCPARPSRNHDISMRRSDRTYACWHCVRTKAQIQAAHDERIAHASDR